MSFYEDAYRSVKEFHIAFGLEVNAVWSPDLLELRKRLIEEEYDELREEWSSDSYSHSALKETCDLVYVLLGTAIALGIRPNYDQYGLSVDSTCAWLDNGQSGDSYEVRARLADCIGATVRWLYDGDFSKQTVAEAFRMVHDSNMSKLVDGKVLYRDDGKVLKGPNYRPCDLSGLAL